MHAGLHCNRRISVSPNNPQVKGLEFNSLSPNLLASGAGECDLCIWDVADAAKPSLYPALKAGAGVPGASGCELTHLAWNKKVQVRGGALLSAGGALGVEAARRCSRLYVTVRYERADRSIAVSMVICGYRIHHVLGPASYLLSNT